MAEECCDRGVLCLSLNPGVVEDVSRVFEDLEADVLSDLNGLPICRPGFGVRENCRNREGRGKIIGL